MYAVTITVRGNGKEKRNSFHMSRLEYNNKKTHHPVPLQYINNNK